jgi:broad specificity phosphatase PhoE
MIDIFLVRHGEAEASWAQAPDPGLSPLGRQQARAVADALQPRLPASTALVSSPRETAEPLAEALASPLAVDEAFREIPTPVPLPQRQDWLRAFMQQRWEQQPPSLHDWRQRAFDALRSVEGPLVVFSHFLLINAVLGLVQGRDETLCFWPANGSITHLTRERGELRLQALGQAMDSVVN